MPVVFNDPSATLPKKTTNPVASPSQDEDLGGKTTSSAGTKDPNAKSSDQPSIKQDAGMIRDGDGTGEDVLQSVGFEPVPNAMSEVFQPSYHFSFYLDSEYLQEQGKGNEFVIAETGLTGMNIQEVIIDSVIGPNIRTKNALTTNVTIRIYEPYGAMLPDLLYQAAVTKQIYNYLKAPWFLQLKLWGYDEEGHMVNIGDKWTWQLTLIDIKSDINETGSMHTITAVPLNETALDNQYGILPSTAKATGNTVGEALKNVITAMNNDVPEKYGKTAVPFIEYAVEARDYPFDTKVGIKNPFDHPLSSSIPTIANQGTDPSYGTQSGQFSSGTDFPAIVDMVLAHCHTAIRMARLSRELPPTVGDDDEKEIRDVMSIMHCVDSKVEYKDYNPVQGNYSRKITYIIRPYLTLRLLTSMGLAKNFDKNAKLNKQKASFAVQQAFLRKEYDYIFTGMNTEVLKFDISINFNWAVSVPKVQGKLTFTGTPAQIDPSKDAFSQSQDTSSAYDDMVKKRQAYEDFEAEYDQPGQTLTADQQAQRDSLKAAYDAAKNQNDQLATIAGKSQDAAKASIPPRKLPPGQSGAILDGEDLVYENAQHPEYQGADQGSQSFMPITITQDAGNPGARATTGTSNDNDPYKTVYGTLLNQLYGSIDANLQTIDLQIKGDPYWLGPGNSGEPFDSPSTDDKINQFNGEHMFVFKFKLPQGYDSETGSVSLPADESPNSAPATGSGDNANTSKGSGGNSDIFTGFYACNMVTNRFSGGQFTQDISAYRVPGWSFEDIIEGRVSTVDESPSMTNSPASSGPQTTGQSTGTSQPTFKANNKLSPYGQANTPFSAVKANIQSAEGTPHLGGYNTLVYNTSPTSNAAGLTQQNLTSMTMGQVYDYQKSVMIPATSGFDGNQSSSAVGAYQFVSGTLAENARDVYGSNWRNVTFSPATQDALAENLWNKVRGNPSQLSQTWAAFGATSIKE